MPPIRWFDRTFDFNYGVEAYPSLVQRLRDAPAAYSREAASLSKELLEVQPDGKWSIKENIGHLVLLEDLWRGRFRAMQSGIQTMPPADLSNAQTRSAGFNEVLLYKLLSRFEQTRRNTLQFLDGLTESELESSAIHPRLQTPMRIIDLMMFVAEHDAHHLWTIQEIIVAHSDMPR